MQKYTFKGLYNFRDIGGLETSNGGRMKEGVLFRSDELSKLSAADIVQFRRLGIKLICDLRTVKEQEKKRSRMIGQAGVKIVHFPIFDQAHQLNYRDFLKSLTSTEAQFDFRDIMSVMYNTLAYESGAQLKEILSLVADEPNVPALIHCTGGKDRTGFTSALLQLLAGVPYDTVMHQYLYSNEVIGPRMKKIETYIRWITLFRAKPEKIKPVLEVRREYLDDVYQKIIAEYGTIEEYVKKICGVDQELIDSYRKIILE